MVKEEKKLTLLCSVMLSPCFIPLCYPELRYASKKSFFSTIIAKNISKLCTLKGHGLIIYFMQGNKLEIRRQLEREILPLQGYKPVLKTAPLNLGMSFIKQAFPNHSFPLGAVHEFMCFGNESIAATAGFITGITADLTRNSGLVAWISNNAKIFPPALELFGMTPERIIFIKAKNNQQILWTVEEALRCDRLSAVVGEINALSFTQSRRLQLAVEKSKVTALLINSNPQAAGTTASIARWKIEPLPGERFEALPGVGFPKWNVQLLKVRNGKPGTWQVQWINGAFRQVHHIPVITGQQHRKAV